MSSVSLGGITVGFDDVGSGDPVVLVHGHPFDRSMWRPQVEHLSRLGWRVIAPDLRGYGESTVVPGTTTLDVFAGDIARLLDHLGIERFVLGGLSLGGQIVLEFHRLFPHRISGMLLADTTAVAETADGVRLRYDTADRLLREGMSGYAAEVLLKMVAPATIVTQPAVADHVGRMMRATDPAGAAAALRGRAERPDYVRGLADVAVPTLVVVGGADEFTPVGEARLISDRVPGATLAIVDGAAHLPNLERPAVFNALLQRFLEALPAASGR
jgi:pimeloyl-ACP methyl ester carboxylesterase